MYNSLYLKVLELFFFALKFGIWKSWRSYCKCTVGKLPASNDACDWHNSIEWHLYMFDLFDGCFYYFILMYISATDFRSYSQHANFMWFYFALHSFIREANVGPISARRACVFSHTQQHNLGIAVRSTVYVIYIHTTHAHHSNMYIRNMIANSPNNNNQNKTGKCRKRALKMFILYRV